jgi:hypothetical protein
MKQEFDRELLAELAYMPEGSTYEGHTIVRNQIVGRSRWSTQHELIFLDPDLRHWRIPFTDGATEMQYQDPFEYDECVAELVEPYSKSTVEFRALAPSEVAA